MVSDLPEQPLSVTLTVNLTLVSSSKRPEPLKSAVLLEWRDCELCLLLCRHRQGDRKM